MASSRLRPQINSGDKISGKDRISTTGQTGIFQRLEELVKTILSSRSHGGYGDAAYEARVQRSIRLCVRILTSHLGEPLVLGDEASITQIIRTRLEKAPTVTGSGIDTTLRFEDLHRRLGLLGCVKNRAAVLHVLHLLADYKGRQGQKARGCAGTPPGLFSEPAGALSGIDLVVQPRPQALQHANEARKEQKEEASEAVSRPKPGRGMGRARVTSEVMERTILRGILYAFQGIDSQYIRYCDEASGYVLDPNIRLGHSERALARGMLEMGWLFTEVVRYVNSVDGIKSDGGGPDVGPGRIQQAFVFSLKEHLTEYYRLIAVLGAQLNLDAGRAEKAAASEVVAAGGGTEGLTLRRLGVWIFDPLERLKLMATLVTSAGHLKGGALASCLHTHVEHGDPLVRGLVERTMVRVCEPIFSMIRNWVFEGELVDRHQEFFVKCSRKGPDEHLWRHYYSLDPRALPKFIDEKVAADILTIGKSINFLRKLCGDTEWIMGAMFKAAGQAETMEYGNTASLRSVVESCSTLTNARLVQLLLGRYRLKSHLRMMKKVLLHGQGDLMLTLAEVLGGELNKQAAGIYTHTIAGIVENVIKTSPIAQQEPEDLARIGVVILPELKGETGWEVFSLAYSVDSPISTIVHSEATLNYRCIFHRLWRFKRVEWTLASAWRLHNSATHLQAEKTIPALKYALHRCSLVRGQMVFLITNLSNYIMFEVLETSWGALQERMDSAKTLDDLINAHDAYLADIMSKSLLNHGSQDVNDKLEEVMAIIIEFCRHQEGLIIRAMAEVTTRRALQRTGGEQEGVGRAEVQRGAGERELDLFGMSHIEDTARRYEDALSDLVHMLEAESVKTEILRFLMFRLDFNDYYKGRRGSMRLPPAPRRRKAAQDEHPRVSK